MGLPSMDTKVGEARLSARCDGLTSKLLIQLTTWIDKYVLHVLTAGPSHASGSERDITGTLRPGVEHQRNMVVVGDCVTGCFARSLPIDLALE